MIDALLEYNPTLLRDLLIIYAVILVLAMIRYGLEKTIFIEHLFYTLSMFVLGILIAIQWTDKAGNDQFSNLKNFGLGLGGSLTLYSVIMIFVFLLRCLLVKTDYIQVSKRTEKVEIVSSFLWATINTTILWGLLTLFILGVGSLVVPLAKIESITIRRIIGVPFAIFIFGTPFYLIAKYTKWVQKLINVGPIKRRIVKVQS